MKQNTLRLPKQITGNFVYVDCGARGESSQPLLNAFSEARYIGFEPDAEECDRLVQQAPEGYSFFPVAVGKQTGSATFYVTQNPGCSSLYVPNQNLFDSFMDCKPFFNILSTQQVKLITLDDYLSQQGIKDVDFLELDTQGAELDILQGAEKLLASNLLGLRVEVEFLAMYQKQPLFADVDSYLRRYGFILFDLERYHLRRKSCPPYVQSREQIVWGKALYLRDYRNLPLDAEVKKQKINKLAVVASYYGFHSYAFEIIDFLLRNPELISDQEMIELKAAYIQYATSLKNSGLVQLMQYLDRSAIRKVFRRLGSLYLKLAEGYLFVTSKQNYFWKD